MQNQHVTGVADVKQCDGFCPVQKTIGVIQAKWTLLILRDLLSGKKRFGQLRKSLAGVSPKTLSVRLKEMETAGILKRKVFAEVPPRVEYELSAKGATLGDVINAMAQWGTKWMMDDAPNGAKPEPPSVQGN
ncbi:MAG: helix-turn-helix transcriptional regulator [Nitrospinae bacterium]|nr:helix-turn-helix transcriptional regulator [Nitrospinota bacterium]